MRRPGCRHNHDDTSIAFTGRVEDDGARESVTRGDLLQKLATLTCSSVVVGALGGGLPAAEAASGSKGEVRVCTTD